MKHILLTLIACLFAMSAVAQLFPDFSKMHFGCDGLHPAEEGQRLMGRYIAKEIRNNYF